jgi:hypothetical protein
LILLNIKFAKVSKSIRFQVIISFKFINMSECISNPLNTSNIQQYKKLTVNSFVIKLKIKKPLKPQLLSYSPLF